MFVCTTCASVWEDGKRVGETGGEKLLKDLQKSHQDWELNEEFVIVPVSCMSACSRSCVISFAANDKYTYLFGDVSLSSTEISAIFLCASSYYNHPQGLLPWAERPEPLKKGILARIPALPKHSEVKNQQSGEFCTTGG